METNDSISQTAKTCVHPIAFANGDASAAAQAYLRDKATALLLEFFEKKGLPAIKREDRDAEWYQDWLDFQARHRLYAEVLSPARYSRRATHFDLLRYARFLEVFAYCSPAHGYSLQVSFLGLAAILSGANGALKQQAVEQLEAGALLAFGVSERSHGSDLMANEFRITPAGTGQWVASGSKYYIGNANVASIIVTLAKEIPEKTDATARIERAPFALIALRPPRQTDRWTEEKIHTFGVRAAHVGGFSVTDHPIAEADIIARGRGAWDAVFGTVTLGKFFLGFGSIGICEHACHEAADHLQQRTLYGKPAASMSHIRMLLDQAHARLLGMKLYAYRAIDYVHAASAADRRYQLFCAVQKAKVSTEGVKVTALLSECVGARGFEADTFCEMALRDAALIPGLEGSMHINLALAAQFAPRYFSRPKRPLPDPPSLMQTQGAIGENDYLWSARAGSLHAIEFNWFLEPFRPLRKIPEVIQFLRQAAIFRKFTQKHGIHGNEKSDTETPIAIGRCLATIVYAGLIAENAVRVQIPANEIASLFALLVIDLSIAAMQLAANPALEPSARPMIARMVRCHR